MGNIWKKYFVLKTTLLISASTKNHISKPEAMGKNKTQLKELLSWL